MFRINFALKCSLRIDSNSLLGGKDLTVGMLTLSLKSNFCTFLSGFRLGIPDFCLIAHLCSAVSQTRLWKSKLKNSSTTPKNYVKTFWLEAIASCLNFTSQKIRSLLCGLVMDFFIYGRNCYIWPAHMRRTFLPL